MIEFFKFLLRNDEVKIIKNLIFTLFLDKNNYDVIKDYESL